MQLKLTAGPLRGCVWLSNVVLIARSAGAAAYGMHSAIMSSILVLSAVYIRSNSTTSIKHTGFREPAQQILRPVA